MFWDDCNGDWGDWGDCSKTCGDGQKTRTFSIQSGTCSNHEGDTETEDCNKAECIGKILCENENVLQY